MFEKTEIIAGLRIFRKNQLGKRRSIPKLLALNTAFMSARKMLNLKQAQNDKVYWGHLVETTAGAYLWNHRPHSCKVFYWRDSENKTDYEIDFVLEYGDRIVAFEIKSFKARRTPQKSCIAFEKKNGSEAHHCG